MGILEDIIKQTGWKAEHVKQELQEAWGWSDSHGPPMHMSEDILALFNSDHPLTADHTPARPKVPAGVINPLMATADFSMENHPYQDYYVAPHRSISHYPFGGF